MLPSLLTEVTLEAIVEQPDSLYPGQKSTSVQSACDLAPSSSLSFGALAAMWENDYVEGAVGGKALVAASTKQKYQNHLHNHILPRWSNTPVTQFRAREVLKWLQQESGSWYMMTDPRNIMSGIFTKAQEWEVLPDTFANPIARVKLPKKWQIYEKRILTEEETVRVLRRLHDPNLLICEICLATGARISEVTGLQVKHVSTDLGYVRIEQRNWRGNIDSPKTERSKRTLTLGSLAVRLKTWIESLEETTLDSWVFPQHDRRKPMWDTGVRAALKGSAREGKCDFPGFGLHSLRRANITWRQEVGGSSIEASRIAGHASTKMTEEYTVVQLRRQEELTRRIQEKLTLAAGRINRTEAAPTSDSQEGQNGLGLASNECDGSIQKIRRDAMPESGRNSKPSRTKKPGKGNHSKKDLILQLLRRPTGVSLGKLISATGWQAHSVRGFLSAAVGKQMGLQVHSTKGENGKRVYRIEP
jgi:integrase